MVDELGRYSLMSGVVWFQNLPEPRLVQTREMGKKNNTPHIQGFISFDDKKKKRISTLSKQLKQYAGTGAWMGSTRGTPIDMQAELVEPETIIFRSRAESINCRLIG